MADQNLSNTTFKLSFELNGRQFGGFEISGLRLLEECASASIQAVRQLLTLDEHVAGQETSLDMDGASTTPNSERSTNETAPADMADEIAPEALEPAATATSVSWDAVMQDMIPSYVKSVSFVVAQPDLSPERQADLSARFPDVQILSGSEMDNQFNGVKAQCATEQRIRQLLTPDATSMPLSATCTGSPLMDTHLLTASEVIPTSSKLPSTRTSVDMRESAQKKDESTYPVESPNTSTILSLAQRIGIESYISDTVRAMWSYWKKNRRVMPFAAARHHRCSLEQFYEGLVTLYILADRNKDSYLCFSILLTVQRTIGDVKYRLPDLATAFLAFQYLPEDNELCDSMARAFAFLWGTQQYQSVKMLMNAFPKTDKEAFSKFIFAIAFIRDPFTKGHNTALLDQWCEGHQHQEGDAEALLCKEVYGKMEATFEKIRRKEAEDEYKEAKKVVDRYEESLRSQPPRQANTPLKGKKRKAESPVVQSKQEHKISGGKGERRRTS